MKPELQPETCDETFLTSSKAPARTIMPNFATADVHSAVTQFLAYEASLLDEDRMAEWMDLLDEKFIYEIPLRVDRERQQGGNQFTPGAYRMHDSKGALQNRIHRLNTGHAWAEELASRTCRLVGAVAVTTTDDLSIVEARSAIFIYRQHGDQRDSEVIPARHDDRIIIGQDGTLRLVRRTVYMTEKCLSTNNLAIVV